MSPDWWPKSRPRCPTRKPLIRRLRHRLAMLVREIMTQHDAPHRIALGVAIGFFIGWLPIVGLQMALGLLLCWLLRANYLASLPGVWMSNPLTMVPMYWIINRVGALFAGEAITLERMYAIWGSIAALLKVHGFWVGSWMGTRFLFIEFLQVTIAMFLGGLLIGTTNAVLVYVPALRMIERYHHRRRERRQGWLARLIQRTSKADESVSQNADEPSSQTTVEPVDPASCEDEERT